MENKNGLSEVMDTMMGKAREMIDHHAVVGEPVVTGDGITLIPLSRVSLGCGSGGSEYGTGNHFAGGGGMGVRLEPVSFLVVKDGSVRIMPVAVPAVNTVDRVLELVPTVVEKVENIVAKKKDGEI